METEVDGLCVRLCRRRTKACLNLVRVRSFKLIECFAWLEHLEQALACFDGHEGLGAIMQMHNGAVLKDGVVFSLSAIS